MGKIHGAFTDSLGINTGATTTWGLAIVDSKSCCGILSCELGGALRGLVCSLAGPAYMRFSGEKSLLFLFKALLIPLGYDGIEGLFSQRRKGNQKIFVHEIRLKCTLIQ